MGKLTIITGLVCAAAIGCQTATVTKTSKDGTQDSIEIKSFLGKINQGSYSNGTGMTLSVADAGPDQQSIAILAGAVADISKAAMFMARPPTNSITTNAP